MKTALIILVFVLVTLGPLLALWLRAASGKLPKTPAPPPDKDDD